MKKEQIDPVHEMLDGGIVPPAGGETEAKLRQYREALDLLDKSRAVVPPGLATRIMSRLPEKPRASWLPAPREWLIPSLTGAAAVTLFLLGWLWFNPPAAPKSEMVKVTFELHAPGAKQVELVGNFNHWQQGALRLEGPDASGHWNATIELPEGRYEYSFLVDGTEWVTDPTAAVVRPDGYGRVNAVLEVSGEGTTL